MSDFQSSSAASEMIGEEDKSPEKIDDSSSIQSREQVLTNDFLLHKILSYLHDPTDKVCAGRVAKKWYSAANDFNDNSTTLSIVRVNMDFNFLVRVSYGNSTRYIKLFHHNLGKKQLDQIMSRLPKSAIVKIRKIVVRGMRREVTGGSYQIIVDESLGEFLDHFEHLKYLELELVYCRTQFFDNITKYAFINRLESLFVPDESIYERNVQKLFGVKIKVLHMFEGTLIGFNHEILTWLCSRPINIVIHKATWRRSCFMNMTELYEKQERKIAQFEELGRYFELPYYNNFYRELHLDREFVPSFKHCQDLATFKLFRLEKCGDEDVIMKRISEIKYFPNLEELEIDVYFDKKHLRKLVAALKQCRMLRNFFIRIRNCTKKKWIYLIRRLPKHIICIELNDIDSDEIITELKLRLSESIESIVILNRKSTLSIESLRRILTEFKGLRYLKVDGIDPSNSGYFSCLKHLKIPTVQYVVAKNLPGFNFATKFLPRMFYCDYISRDGMFMTIRHEGYSATDTDSD